MMRADPQSKSPRAFTIAEVIVAAVVTAFLALATTVAISQAARARDASAGRLEAHLRAETAASRIARDAENAVRDPEVFFTRVSITSGKGGAGEQDEILLYSRSLKTARPRDDQGEGGEYEVQYRLEASPPGIADAQGRPPAGMLLWRRMDPVPDDFPDAGGVASVIADGVVSLTLRAYDGSQWFSAWDSDRQGYPHAVSVSVSATDPTGKYEATSRRVVALDRTPLPKTPVAADEQPTTSGSGTSSP
jgi:hypothetical protein